MVGRARGYRVAGELAAARRAVGRPRRLTRTLTTALPPHPHPTEAPPLPARVPRGAHALLRRRHLPRHWRQARARRPARRLHRRLARQGAAPPNCWLVVLLQLLPRLVLTQSAVFHQQGNPNPAHSPPPPPHTHTPALDKKLLLSLGGAARLFRPVLEHVGGSFRASHLAGLADLTPEERTTFCQARGAGRACRQPPVPPSFARTVHPPTHS